MLINQNLKVLCCSFVFLFPVSILAQLISIDEDFSDWESIGSFYDDATGDNSGTPIDFKTLKIYNDDRFIYFYLEVGEEINLQEGNNISLLIDIDSNSETGESFSGIGYEFIFNFGQRSGQFFDPNSSGFNSYDIGLVSAPTVSSAIFEIKIDRDAEIDGTPLFTSQSFDFLFRSSASNGDLLPDNGSGTLTYVLNNDNIYEEESYSLKKKVRTISEFYPTMLKGIICSIHQQKRISEEYFKPLMLILLDWRRSMKIVANRQPL